MADRVKRAQQAKTAQAIRAVHLFPLVFFPILADVKAKCALVTITAVWLCLQVFASEKRQVKKYQNKYLKK